jgi:hypothetical protein
MSDDHREESFYSSARATASATAGEQEEEK